MRRLLFVCLGNICRSPMAEAAVRAAAERQGLAVTVDSAGTGGWHIGAPPDRRMQAAARAAGYDLSGLRARQAAPEDFGRFDVIYAMDRSNRADLEALRPAGSATPVRLYLSHLARAGPDVPDPYYAGGFDAVAALIADGAAALVEDLAR